MNNQIDGVYEHGHKLYRSRLSTNNNFFPTTGGRPPETTADLQLGKVLAMLIQDGSDRDDSFGGDSKAGLT
jgi:hypothetical protein